VKGVGADLNDGTRSSTIKRLRIGAVAVGGLVLAAVIARLLANPSPSRPPAPARAVVLTWPAESLAALPIAVAAASGWLARAGLRVVNRPGATLVVESDTFPVQAVLLQRPDWVLVSPDPDPDFRWRDVAGLPLAVVEATPAVLRLAEGVLKDHGVAAVTWEPLSVGEALRLLQGHRLPWLLAPLMTAEGPLADRAPYPLAYLGAATGPLAWTVIAGHPALPPRLLAVLNRAMLWIRTTDAARVAARVEGRYRSWTRARLTTVIATAQGLDLFPLTVYPTTALYARAAEWLGTPEHPWPPYAEGADVEPARRALETGIP
jgi:hypothetical protein